MTFSADILWLNTLTELPFVKAQALGNDFVMIQLSRFEKILPTDSDLSKLAIYLADRRLGVGCDQVIVVDDVTIKTISFPLVRFFNSDGSEAESCGNGSRAFGLWWMEKYALHDFSFETKGGIVTVKYNNDSCVDLILSRPIVDDRVDIGQMAYLSSPAPVYVNVGNPHVVLFVRCDNDVNEFGAQIERLPVFPNRANVNFVHMGRCDFDANHLYLNVWERGAGRTNACGTGGVATAAAAVRRNLVNDDRAITVSQEGGELRILFTKEHVILSGRAQVVFDGVITVRNQ